MPWRIGLSTWVESGEPSWQQCWQGYGCGMGVGWMRTMHARGQGGGKIQPQSGEGGAGGASSEAWRDGHGLQPVMAIMKCKEDLVE